MFMLSARFSSLTLFLLLIIHSAAGNAQDLKAEQAKLTAFQQQLTELKSQQQQLQQALQKNKATLAPLANSSSPEKAALDLAREELQEALANQAAEPSDTNEARVNNAEFKLALAERKFKKANEEQFALEEQAGALTTQLANLNEAIAALNRSIEQQQQVVQTRQQQAAAVQARQEQTQRQKALAAEQEIARLKAKLAEQERIEAELKAKALAAEKAAQALAAQQATSAATAAPTSQATSQTTAATTPTPTTATDTAPANTTPQTQLASLSAPVAQTTGTEPSPSKGNSGIIFLHSADAIEAERQRLAQILAQPEAKKGSSYNKILNVKAIGEGGTTGPAIAHGLRPKGHNIYQGTADLAAGETLFIVGFNRWQQQVEAVSAGPGNTFIVTFDGSDPKKPKLIYYPQALEP